jgi:hypothetical protein
MTQKCVLACSGGPARIDLLKGPGSPSFPKEAEGIIRRYRLRLRLNRSLGKGL